MNNPNKVYLMDPSGTLESRKEVFLAGRLGSLEGAVIGILSNQKPNVNPLLEELGQILTDKYKVGTLKYVFKPSQSQPADEQIMNELLTCDAIVHGVAD